MALVMIINVHHNNYDNTLNRHHLDHDKKHGGVIRTRFVNLYGCLSPLQRVQVLSVSGPRYFCPSISMPSKLISELNPNHLLTSKQQASSVLIDLRVYILLRTLLIHSTGSNIAEKDCDDL